MAIYTYDDSFIVDSIDAAELDNEELKAIEEVEKVGISDAFYKEKAVVSKVYIELSLMQLENDGMNDKYKAYKEKYKEYISLAKNNSSSANVSTMPIARG